MTVDRDRLVEWALRAVSTPSFTGSEEAMARLMEETFRGMGLQVQWQQVEDGRANVLGTWAGAGDGQVWSARGVPDARPHRGEGEPVLPRRDDVRGVGQPRP